MTPALAATARRSACLLMGTLALGIAVPVAAQPGYADGITVYGHPGRHRLPNDDPELSRRVHYSDLDLTTQAGQDVLNWRIARTAQELCSRLGEDNEQSQNSAVLPTCQAAARDSAYAQAHRVIEAAQYQPRYAPAPTYSYSYAYPTAPAYSYPSAPVYSYETAPATSYSYYSGPQTYWSAPTETTTSTQQTYETARSWSYGQ